MVQVNQNHKKNEMKKTTNNFYMKKTNNFIASALGMNGFFRMSNWKITKETWEILEFNNKKDKIHKEHISLGKTMVWVQILKMKNKHIYLSWFHITPMMMLRLVILNQLINLLMINYMMLLMICMMSIFQLSKLNDKQNKIIYSL